MSIKEYKVVKLKGKERKEAIEQVIEEKIIQVYINGSKYPELLTCLDENIEEMFLGRFFNWDIKNIEISEKDVKIELGEKRPLPQLKENTSCKAEEMFEAMRYLVNASIAFKKTGGTHCAALYHKDELIYFCEDLSRRCAIEKILGKARKAKRDMGNCFIVVSCRITEDICNMIINSGISIIGSKAAPTDKAIDLAKKRKGTLACFVRGDGMNIYSGEDRIWTK